ncbi:MAG: TfuA-like protein [Rhizobiaceae bacterium]|nr:TfuA-like protein [Rhizobiaceae bacterium]
MRPKLAFVGPTLARDEAGVVTDAVLLPPAVQGSVIDAVQRFDPAAILIVDGGFQTEPAVRHKEILWAIGNGVPVLGAASMGALRAAELAPFMQGVGVVYRWYRRFVYAPDDAVAVLHGPADMGCAPLTDALVDIRLTVRAAWRGGLIGGACAAALNTAASDMDFRTRTLEAVVRRVFEREPAKAARVAAMLRASFVSRKKADALLALRMLQEGRFAPAPSLPPMPLTAAFAADLSAAGLTLAWPECPGPRESVYPTSGQ